MTAEQQAAVNDRLRQLQEESGGQLTAALVIEDAKNISSPLHSHFEWDESRAAYSHWVTVACRLINGFKVHVVVSQYEVRVPTYVREPATPKVFCPIAEMAKRADDRVKVVDEEIARAVRAIERAKGVAVGLGFRDSILSILDAARATLDKVTDAMAAEPVKKPRPRKKATAK